MRSTSPNRLLILACSATKKTDAGRIPALHRYDGPLWQTLRAADPCGEKARVAFVSARFGFGCAADLIEDYDEKLTELRASELIAGGIRQHWPKRAKKFARLPPSGKNAWSAIAGLADNGRQPFSEVCIVGGGLYLQVMRRFVEHFRIPHETPFETETPWVFPDAPLVEINGPIGIMRKELRAWLDEPAQLPLALAA